MHVTRRPLVLVLLVLAVLVLLVDQLTKVWAVANLTEGERTPLVGDLLGLSLLYNPGAALSFATGMTWVFTVAAVVVAVVILRVANRLGSRSWTIALGLLLGGAVGNLFDRMLRPPALARGHVVDFIAYGDLFVGNVADIAIVAAATLIVLLTLRGIGVDGSRAPKDVEPTDETPAVDVPADEPAVVVGAPDETLDGPAHEAAPGSEHATEGIPEHTSTHRESRHAHRADAPAQDNL